MMEPITVDLEGFSITMETVFNFSKNNIPKIHLWPSQIVCAKFRSDRLGNGGEDKHHSHRLLVYL